MTVLDDVKLSMGISNNKRDSDIEATIEACKMDLKISGVNRRDDRDSLVLHAIKLYCKWNFDYQGRGGDFSAAYQHLKQAMSISREYTEDFNA